MRHLLIHLFVITTSLGVAAWLLPGVGVDSLPALLVGGVVLSVVNAWVRPVLAFFTLPITVLTLGLFLLVVNGLAFGLAAWLVPGFSVGSFLWAVAGAMIVSVLSLFLHSMLDAPSNHGQHPGPTHG